MNRRVELSNDKKIATTLTVPGTIRTAVGRKIWSKIPRKTCVKKLVNKCGCALNTMHCSTRSQCNFISTGLILVYQLVFDTILAALFGMPCNLHRLKLERLLKSELQYSNRLLTTALATSTETS